MYYEKMMIGINGTKLIKLCDNYFWLKYFIAEFFDIEVKNCTLMGKIAFLIASLLIYVFYNMGGSVAILLLYTCRLPLLCNDKCNI